MPRVSVIVPVYNVESYLNRCIGSILSQSFTDFELILIDDGSPDNCPQICDDYAEKDNRIVVIHKENGGLSDARNKGIEYALNSGSEYITFIDSDDIVSHCYLEFLIKASSDAPNSIIISSFARFVTEDELLPQTIYTFDLFSTEDFFVNNRINSVIACGKLFPTRYFNNIHFPFGKLHEDEFTTYKLLFMCKDVIFIENQLYYYRINEYSITQSNWNLRRLDAIDAFKEQLAYFKSNGFAKAYISSLYAIITTELKSINSLREYYPDESEILKTVIVDTKKHIKEYSELSVMDDDLQSHIEKTLHPKRHNIRKIVKKKISNLKEILHIK